MRGYSLVECIIVIAIVSILAVIVAPSLQGHLKRTRDQALLQQLVEVIRFASQAAHHRGEAVGVCRSDDGKICTQQGTKLIVFTDASHVLFQKQLNLYAGKLYWRAYPFYRNYLAFLPYDYLAVDNGAFWYCHPHQTLPTWLILISRSGQTRELYPAANGVNDSQGKAFACT